MHCRVFVNADGSVRIMHPNMKYWDARLETSEDFCRRICDEDMLKDPSLVGLAYYDVDADTAERIHAAKTVQEVRTLVKEIQ